MSTINVQILSNNQPFSLASQNETSIPIWRPYHKNANRRRCNTGERDGGKWRVYSCHCSVTHCLTHYVATTPPPPSTPFPAKIGASLTPLYKQLPVVVRPLLRQCSKLIVKAEQATISVCKSHALLCFKNIENLDYPSARHTSGHELSCRPKLSIKLFR